MTRHNRLHTPLLPRPVVTRPYTNPEPRTFLQLFCQRLPAGSKLTINLQAAFHSVWKL